MSVLVDRFVRDTRFALRRLIRHPIFTTFSILTLAAGVGVTTAAYSGVALTTSAGLRLPESETVVFLTTAGTRRPQTTPRIHLSDVAELSRQQHSFEAVAAFLTLSTSVSARGNARLTQVEAVTSEYFDAIRARASLGRLISAGDTAPGSSPVVVLSHQAWRSEFNSDPAVLGSSIHIGGVAATVIGVASPDVHGAGALFSFQRRAWIPLPVGLRLRHHGASAVTQGSDPFLTVFGRLKAGTTLETAQAEIGIIGGRLETAKRPDELPERATDRGRWTLVPYDAARASVSPATGATTYAVLLLPLLVLLTACSTLANLTFSRNTARAGELTTRAALGASRWRLIWEQTVDAAIVCLFGGFLGLLVARALIVWAQGAVANLVAAFLPAAQLEWRVDGGVLAVVALAVLLSTLAGGLVPAWLMSRANVGGQLSRHSTSTSAPRWRGRANVIALQVGTSVCLFLFALMAVGFLESSRRRAVQADLDQWAIGLILLADQNYSEQQAFDTATKIASHLGADPQAGAVIVGNYLPMRLPWVRFPQVSIQAAVSAAALAEGGESLDLLGVTPNAARSLDLTILSGRDILPADDRQSSEVPMMIGATLAERLFGTREALGRVLYWRHSRMPSDRDRARSAIVTGVFADRNLGNGGNAFALTSMAHTRLPALTIAVRARTGDASSLVQSIQRAVAAADSTLAVASAGRADKLGGAPAMVARLVVLVATVLALTALLLSMAGLYGVLAEVVSLRLRELGVRLALGASRHAVVLLVVGDGLKPVLEGAVIGVAAAFVGRQIAQFVSADALPALTLTAVGQILALLSAVAVLACLIPARQALSANPTELLKDV